jgi:hypothetical protein
MEMEQDQLWRQTHTVFCLASLHNAGFIAYRFASHSRHRVARGALFAVRRNSMRLDETIPYPDHV